MPAKLITSGAHVNYVGPTGGYLAGNLVNLGTGKVGIGANDIAEGETGSLAIAGEYSIPNSGLAFNSGDTVGYDATNDVAVAAGTGDFDIGTAQYASATTDANVKFLLNDKHL